MSGAENETAPTVAQLGRLLAELIDRLPEGVQPGSPAATRRRQATDTRSRAHDQSEKDRGELRQRVAKDPHLASLDSISKGRAVGQHLATAQRDAAPDGCCEFCCGSPSHSHDWQARQ